MYRCLSAFVCAVFVGLALNGALMVSTAIPDTDSLKDDVELLLKELKESSKNTEKMNKRIGALSRQMMLQQLFIEERLRSEGQSGIKQVRNSFVGTKTYHSTSHVGRAVASIHDHSNNVRTVGMGEFIGVLNGVEFRTRHNDYRLYMPSTTSGNYDEVEDIPFPDVPPEVTGKATVKEQVEEMVEWFKAWKNGDYSTRDYRKYFKPVLSYLEGTWTKNTANIDEPFESDRHFVDANSWFDLQEKIRFTSYSGRKDNLENFAYLPTTIMETINETTAVFAQWNYRIVCHPLKSDVPLNRLRMVDDIASRLSGQHTMEEQRQTRAARFQVNPEDKNTWRERAYRFNFLDKLMSEIPGKDNYPGDLIDDAFGQEAYSMDPAKPNQKLNAGYYHRWYKVLEKGAMGIQTRTRGFSDPSLFMAMNSRDKVAGMKIDVCRGKGKNEVCQKYDQKWSYAVPMEIIFLTPLNKWNPYNLIFKGKANSNEGKTVIANGRNGGSTKNKAFNGLNSKTYYITPNEFFTGTETSVDAADTTKGSVGVLDPTGEVRMVRASGVRVFFPNIPGIGILRQRYPIMPIHAEGSTTWKELEAVQDLLMQSKTHARLFREKLVSDDIDGGTTNPDKNTDTVLKTGYSRKENIAPGIVVQKHFHEVTLTPDEVNLMQRTFKPGKVTKITSKVQSHQHEIEISWNRKRQRFYISRCASTPNITRPFQHKCKDEHPAFMVKVQDQ